MGNNPVPKINPVQSECEAILLRRSFHQTADTAMTVLYDGACPLCRKEISFYRRRKGADRLKWLDVSRVDNAEVAPGLSRDQALRRFHVLHSNGTVIDGGAAFAQLWTALPAFRYAGLLFQLPPFVWMLNFGYDLFLKVRPWMQQKLGSGCSTICDTTAEPSKKCAL